MYVLNVGLLVSANVNKPIIRLDVRIFLNFLELKNVDNKRKRIVRF